MARHRKEDREQAAIRDSKQRLRDRQSFTEGTRSEIEEQRNRAYERQRLARNDDTDAGQAR